MTRSITVETAGRHPTNISMQEPELVSHPGFAACGISVRTSSAIENNPATARVPRILRRFYADALPARLGANSLNGRVVAVYSDYENGSLGSFTVTAAVQLRGNHGAPPEFDKVAVSAGEYLRFTVFGTGPGQLASVWTHVNEFFSQVEHPLAGKYERAYTADFERFGDPESVSIFIAVKRKLGVHGFAARLHSIGRKI